MDFKDNLPIYIQITNQLKKKIASGVLKKGDKLQSVRELSAEVKANPNTIQRAYSELEREGLVYTQRGMGSFVTDNESTIKELKKDMASNLVKSYIADMKSIGFSKEELLKMINHQMEGEKE